MITTTNKISWILFILVVIPILLWSTQIWVNPNPFKKKTCNGPRDPAYGVQTGMLKSRPHLLYHYQEDIGKSITRKNGIFEWIFNAGVCPLGRLSFYLTIIAVTIFLCVATFEKPDKWIKQQKIWKIVLLSLIGFYGLMMLGMNPPLFIRSIRVLVVLVLIVLLNTNSI